MRRLHLRGRDNILKRLLIHAAAFNISLILRKQLGRGKPRQFQRLSREFFAFYFLILAAFSRDMADSETASAALPSKPTIPRLTFERSLPDSRRALPPSLSFKNSYYCHGLLEAVSSEKEFGRQLNDAGRKSAIDNPGLGRARNSV